MPRYVEPRELAELIGLSLPPSDWLTIDQDRIDRFAESTNDHQFIHVDPERAQETAFGSTIAHGFLTQSLIVHLISEHMLVPTGTAVTLNYGSDKVRFLAPVRVGRRIRAKQQLLEAVEKRPGQWLLKKRVEIEIDGEDTPALISETLLMHIVE